LVLGTTVTVTIYDEVPNGAFEKVFSRIKDIEEKMSTSEEDYDSTELMKVNRNAGKQPVEVSQDTFTVVKAGLEFTALTDGAFDVTVGPLVDLWGIGTEEAEVPSEEEIAAVLPKIDADKVRLDAEAGTIYLEEEGMALDVGGIAKGYAADEVASMLKDMGVEHALLDFGGNILTVGKKPNGDEWKIGIQNPGQTRGKYLGIVTTGPKTIVTSGNYERYFEKDGVRYHHILDTENGYPSRTGLASVTIVTDRSMAADALATAAYAMGPEKGLEFVRELRDVEAAFVSKENEVFLTDGMRSVFSLENEAYSEASLAHQAD
jgi:thiamine biosynthesis lipoprotein